MWLNNEKITDTAISTYRDSLLHSCPNHIVIDGLFDDAKLDAVTAILQQAHNWHTQQHTYSALYVDQAQWQNTLQDQRFVQRDVWRRDLANPGVAQEFLSFLRSDGFMSVISRIFNVPLTDKNVSELDINTNYFRLGASDFVEQHADDSPGREVCLLLYLNQEWSHDAGGELCFASDANQAGVNNDIKKGDKNEGEPTVISPLFNRCVLFDPSSKGSEHWVKKLNAKLDREKSTNNYRYNVTSWYWSE